MFVKWNGTIHHITCNGVKQGGVLSPIFCNLVVQPIRLLEQLKMFIILFLFLECSTNCVTCDELSTHCLTCNVDEVMQVDTCQDSCNDGWFTEAGSVVCTGIIYIVKCIHLC